MLVAATPGCAQFAELVTTDDGSQLLFTSRSILKSAEPSVRSETRLYRYAANEVGLFAERGSAANLSNPWDNDGISNPSVSGDGTVVGYTRNNVCGRNSDCSDRGYRVEVRGRETLDLGPGVVQISRDGRWALVTKEVPGSDAGSDMISRRVTSTTLIELSTGRRTEHVPATGRRVFTLASGGAVLAIKLDLGAPLGIGGVTPVLTGIWKNGQFTAIAMPKGDAWAIALSDDASTVVCDAIGASSERRLMAVSVASGKATTVYESRDPLRTPVFMALSNDGQRVLYKVKDHEGVQGTPFVWDTLMGVTIPIPLASGELATDGALSGNGRVAFVATNRSRILKFDIESRIAAPLFPQTPYCDDPGPVAGGSLTRLRCSFSGMVQDLQGQFLYDGTPMPVVYSRPDEIAVQVPWEWFNFVFFHLMSLKVPSDSPFWGSQQLRVYDGAPRILSAGPGEPDTFGVTMIKGDWSGVLNSPPVPGDVVHMYMTGLGWPVHRETTGVAASTARANPIQLDLTCRFLPQDKPAELLFAGLAPGMIGVYQTSFRIAADETAGPLTGVRCNLSNRVMSVPFGPGIPPHGVFGRAITAGPAWAPPR